MKKISCLYQSGGVAKLVARIYKAKVQKFASMPGQAFFAHKKVTWAR
jgi:hypothetical protein